VRESGTDDDGWGSGGRGFKSRRPDSNGEPHGSPFCVGPRASAAAARSARGLPVKSRTKVFPSVAVPTRKRGMSEQLLSDLAAAIDAFEQTLEATRAGRRDHVGASADLRAVMAEVSEQVKVLDGVVRYRFGDYAGLVGAWASAHSVVGPFRSRTVAPDSPAAPADPGAGGETPTEVKAA
jgi:hypothetical protein